MEFLGLISAMQCEGNTIWVDKTERYVLNRGARWNFDPCWASRESVLRATDRPLLPSMAANRWLNPSVFSLACKLSPLSPGGLTWMCRKMSKLNFVGSLSALRSSVAMWEGRGDPTSPYNLRLPTIYTGDDSLLTRNVSENIEKLIDSPRSQPRSVKIGEGSACSLSPGSPYTPSPQSPARWEPATEILGVFNFKKNFLIFIRGRYWPIKVATLSPFPTLHFWSEGK